MHEQSLPEITIDPVLKLEIGAVAESFLFLGDAEAAALASKIAAPLHANERWTRFCEVVSLSIRDSGFIVVRGLQADEGRSLLIVSTAFGATFDTYGQGRIVKRFRMSPWTNELSHTTRAGDFHTDGNVSDAPPSGTAIQCEQEDPGAPEFGAQRVAYLPHLLGRLASGDPGDAVAFAYLTESVATMAHERSPKLWRGVLVQNDTIRYHPHSLRIASKRLDPQPMAIDAVISAIHRAATDVSVPFHTHPGDTVLVSNRTALHYRGPCSVRFTRFPTEFDSRSVLVLHLKEPAK
jgi:hypothetical protein